MTLTIKKYTLAVFCLATMLLSQTKSCLGCELDYYARKAYSRSMILVLKRHSLIRHIEKIGNEERIDHTELENLIGLIEKIDKISIIKKIERRHKKDLIPIIENGKLAAYIKAKTAKKPRRHRVSVRQLHSSPDSDEDFSFSRQYKHRIPHESTVQPSENPFGPADEDQQFLFDEQIAPIQPHDKQPCLDDSLMFALDV